MLEIGFWWRNYASNKTVKRVASELNKSVRASYSYGKAMRAYRKRRKEDGTYVCFNCNETIGLHIHHIVPVSVDISLADKEYNFMLACPTCHYDACHGKDWTKYHPLPWTASRRFHSELIVTEAHEEKE